MFKEKYKGVALTSVDLATVISIDECDWLRHELTLDVADLEKAINVARAKAAHGVYSDPEWYHSTNQLLRETKAMLQALQARRGQLSREGRERLERAFVDVAKEVLPRETFHRLMDRAEARIK